MGHFATRRPVRELLSRRARAVVSRRPTPLEFFRGPPSQSPAEEWANGLTHAAAALASLAGAVWLVATAARGGSVIMTIGCTAYSASLIAVFAMSALSHLIRRPRLRQRFRALDQACIYLLIAGSGTPYAIRFLIPSGWGWMLAATWGLALFGAWAKLRGDRINAVSTSLYVSLGWLPAVAAKPLLAGMPAGCIALVLSGGGLYTLGVLFLLHDERHRFFHTIWHVLVIAASACFYAGIAVFVI